MSNKIIPFIVIMAKTDHGGLIVGFTDYLWVIGLSFIIISIFIVIYVAKSPWYGKDAEKAKHAIDQIADQRKIASIIAAIKLPEVREYAIAKITNPTILEEFARRTNNTALLHRAIRNKEKPKVVKSYAYYVKYYVEEIKQIMERHSWRVSDQEGNWDTQYTDACRPALIEVGKRIYEQGGYQLMRQVSREGHVGEIFSWWDDIDGWKNKK